MEPEMDREPRPKGIKRKAAAAVFLFLAVLAVTAAGIVLRAGKRNPEGQGKDGDASRQATGDPAGWEDDSWFTDAGPAVEDPDADPAGEEPAGEDAGTAEPVPEDGSGEDPAGVRTDPVPVQDITVCPGESAVFQCYEPGAEGYRWEFYSTLDGTWEDAGRRQELAEGTREDGGRKLSTLEVPGKPENAGLAVRCTAAVPDGENAVSEGTLRLYDGGTDGITGITVAPVEAETGGYLSALSLCVTMQDGQGEGTELTGLQQLTFRISQGGEEFSSVYDEESGLTTETRTETLKETRYFPVAEGEQDVPVMLRMDGAEYTATVTVTGQDTTAPVLSDVRAEHAVSRTDVPSTAVKLYARAEDN